MGHKELFQRVSIFADLDDVALSAERDLPRDRGIVSREDRGEALSLSELQRRGFIELSGRRIVLRASSVLNDDHALEAG